MSNSKNMLVDNWGRKIDYLRIAVTDRCNLRCFYCMPEHGINYLPRKELLSYEEIIRVAEIVSSLGINKIRITGGEPFIRKDLCYLLKSLNEIEGIDSLHITTNGVTTHQYLDQFSELGIDSVNLSLDTLDKDKFFKITRRDELDNVMITLNGLIERKIATKINMVVMEDHNIEDILPMLELSKNDDLDIRFIEEMPFNGEAGHLVNMKWNHKNILDLIRTKHPVKAVQKEDPSATAELYQIPGYKGRFGIIPAYSRTFCNTCNRLRITAQGTIKSCLYDEGVLDIKSHLRNGASNDEVANLFKAIVGRREKNGFDAEKNRKNKNIDESMSVIGG